MRILITGSNGLLGQKIVARCLKHNIDFIATSKGENRNPDCPADRYRELDITDPPAISQLFDEARLTAVIHTAAITNVDYCELNPAEAKLVNTDATGFLFEACKQRGIHFELVSTDFVFDGRKGDYSETDAVNPLSVYAQSKVDAEKILIGDNYTNWSIARTIIVYGTGHNLSRSNMILWALDALPKGDTMKLVNDQFRAPTWADDLAYGCVEIILRGKTGIFHLSGPQTYSIEAIVRKIAQHIGVENPVIETISSATLNQPAARPPKTGFDLRKAKKELEYSPKTIEETIDLLRFQLKQ